MVRFYCRFRDPEPWQCPLVAPKTKQAGHLSGRAAPPGKTPYTHSPHTGTSASALASPPHTVARTTKTRWN